MPKKIVLVFSFLFSLFYVRSQCNHVFNMYDSWGDGWNGGASVDLVVNGATVISGATLSNGSAGSQNFNASSGDLIELANWNGGSYPSEISWDVQDGSGSVIASGLVGDNAVGNGNCPSCIPPFNLNNTNVTSLGSDISWTAGGNETMWNLEYGASGFTQGSGSYLISGVTSPYSITGLTANTSYDVYIQADCGSGVTSSWTGPYSFKTLCDAISNFPYNIDFESGLGCWTSEDIDGGNSWQLFSGAGSGGSSYAAGITYNATAHDDYLISPQFQVTTGLSDRISFMAQDYGGYGETFDVMVSTSGFSAADFTITLASAVTPSSSYSYYEYDLSAYSGQDIYVSIKATGTNGYYLFIDDVTIDQMPSCIDPSSIVSSNVSMNDAVIAWISSGNEALWNIEYGLSGFSLGTGNLVSTNTTNYNLTNLNDNTSYDIYVRSDCGSGLTSNWVGPYSFLTDPAPGSCGFFTLELYDSWGDGWNGGSIDVVVNGSSLFSGLTIINGTGPEIFLVPVDLGDVVDFNYTAGSYSGENYYRVYDHNGLLIIEQGLGNNSPISQSANACPSCPDPSTISANNITADQIDLTWISNGNESAWNIEYGLSGFTIGTGSLLNVATNPSSISGLSENTTYDIFLQADCGGGSVSSWIGPFSFTTNFNPGTCGIYNLELSDSYGDGWNGGLIDVFINGTSFYSGLTVASGYGPETFQIPVDLGDIIDLIYSPGSFPSENSYQVYDHNGAIVSQEGLNNTVPNSVIVNACPSCSDPSSIVTNNITASSVEIGWTSTGSESLWNIEYGLTGFVPGSGTIISVGNNPYSLSSLSDNSTYDVYIQADCGGGLTSSWVGPYSFTTNPLPGTCGMYNLELYDSYGDGWGGGSMDVIINGTAYYSGLTIVSGFGPEIFQIPVDIGDLVSFNYTSGSWSSENSYKVYDQNGLLIFEEGSSGSTPNSVTGINACPSCSDPTALSVSNISASGGDVSWTPTGTETIWSLEYGIPGFSIGSGTLLNVTNNNFSLSGLNDNTSYEIYVQAYCGGGLTSNWVGPFDFTTNPAPGTCGFFTLELYDSWGDGWNSGSISVLVNGISYYSGLTIISGAGPEIFQIPVDSGDVVDFNYAAGYYPGENYYKIYDQNNSLIFEEGVGGLIPNSISAVSACSSCSDPISLSSNNITSSGADLNWISTGNETSWKVEYGLSGFSQGTGLLTSTTITSLNLTGLTENTIYDYYVQADCGSGNESQWIGPLSFITNIENGCLHSLNLYDSYGDGWSGSSVDLLLNGVTIINGATISSGFVNNISFLASSGSNITLSNWVTGSWTSEVSWDITDVNGNIISSGSFGDLGFGLGNCCPIITGTDTQVACDSYVWIDGNMYSSSNNTATHTLINSTGCDSVVTLDLTLNNSTSNYSNISSCNSFIWNNNSYSSSGLYIDTLINSSGCLLIDSLNLNITNSSVSLVEYSCNSYSWNGTSYDTSGTYYHTNGSCIDTLYLIIYYPEYTNDSITACDSYIWNSSFLNSSGDYTDTLQNINGCDSIVNLNLQLLSSSTSMESLIECDTATWHGNYYTTTGFYYDTLLNAEGCDSVVTLDLTVNYSSFSNDVITACDNYEWIDGITYNQSNASATFINTNSLGCDSTIFLNLTINNSAFSDDTIIGCDTIFRNNKTITTSGLYYDTIPTIYGCDSVVLLDVTINYSNYVTDQITACDSYTWIDGNTYFSDNNTGLHILSNSNGCDSIINIDLTINYSSSSNDSIISCDSYDWNGTTYTNSGIYVDTLQTILGCDSIVSMDIVINYSASSNDSVISCDSYDWNGNTYTNSGVYIDTLQTSNGCDSVVSMDMVINYSASTSDSIIACDSMEWNGNNYTTSGVYVDTLQTSNGCDSIVTMDMIINYSASSTENITTCDSMEWNGDNYTTSGVYLDTLQTINGCDSVITLNLTINYTKITNENIVSCDFYNWNGAIFYSSGIYYDTLISSNGCDSILVLDLVINNSFNVIDTQIACDNYNWNGANYNSSGIYYDTLQSIDGCDSLVTLDLTVYNTKFTNETISTCDLYNWNGTDYNSTGLYIDTLQSIDGCDSIVTLDLTINYSYVISDVQISCDQYVWNGTLYNNSGIFIDTLISLYGCDSIVALDLTINNTTYGTDTQVACDSYVWIDGISYTTNNNTATYILTNFQGCDSIVTLDLTINSSYNHLETIISCGFYNWNGNNYNQSGFYIDSLQSIDGCDSVVMLSLIIHNTSLDTIQVNACDFYIWNGLVYTQSVILNDTLTNIYGCDSVLVLNVNVGNANNSNDTIVACDEYLWGGILYNQSGDYISTFQNASGCDSVVSLNLTINNSSIGDTLNITSCDDFNWNGNQYNQSGFYRDTITSTLGCDSVIFLDLLINNSVNNINNVISCYDFSWNGTIYTTSGTYIDSLQTVQGCDSINILNLTIINTYYSQDTVISCSSLIINNTIYDSSGIYIDTLQSVNGCDSVVTLFVSILNNSYSVDSVISCGPYSWNNNPFITQSGTFYDTIQTVNGCDSLMTLFLEILPEYNDTIYASTCDTFNWNGVIYSSSGIYSNNYTTYQGCDSIKVLNLSINDSYTSPVVLELLLDDYCAETYWTISDVNGIIHQEGPYNCEANGSGPQANDSVIRSLSLTPLSCYKFTLYDGFGDGLGASEWGGTDGGWMLKDYNGLLLSDGQGNFGDSISVNFYINEDLSTSILETNYGNQSKIVAFPNPFIGETEIRILNFNEIYDISLYDIQGKVVRQIENINQESFILNSGNISNGVYWLMVNNHPEIKPLKLIVK